MNHINCKGCGHPLRPGKASAADYPGTRNDRGGGYCRVCKALEKAGEMELAVCKGCKRDIRPDGAPLEHFPDTVSVGADGHCASCYAAVREGRPINPHPEEPVHKPMPEEVEEKAELNKSSLDYWMQARRARQVRQARAQALMARLTHAA